MKKIFCNVCGKEIVSNIEEARVMIKIGFWKDYGWDLCPDCKKKFLDSIHWLLNV